MLAHELAHAILHEERDGLNREQAELEAESVAYVVRADLGVDTSAYSFGYLASWPAADVHPACRAPHPGRLRADSQHLRSSITGCCRVGEAAARGAQPHSRISHALALYRHHASTVQQFILEIYFEHDSDSDAAARAGAAVRGLVAQLAPHVALQVVVLKAHAIGRSHFESGGSRRDVPHHDASDPSRQSLLITSEEIGAQGWGGRGSCVVNKQALESKEARGGNMADIVIHEWLHTIEAAIINGRPVPFVDDAEKLGFTPGTGPDGESTWHDWYRFALGGKPL